MSKDKGTLFLGEMVGCEGGGERGEGKRDKFWKKGEERKQFLHDEETFDKMWREVAERTETVGCWEVEGAFKKREEGSSGGSHGCAFFTGEGIGVRAVFYQNLHCIISNPDQNTPVGPERRLTAIADFPVP